MSAKFAVIVFPGSNCDHDAYHALKHVMGTDCHFVWHKETSLGDVDAVVIPGGFSYGDYLRSGAIARFSPVMKAVLEFATKGGLVIGICNGFQILLESGLLPGAMMHNEQLKFNCKKVHLLTETSDTPFTSTITRGKVLQMPIAHGEGNYYADESIIKRLQDKDQIVFRYCDENGTVSPENNPNGTLHNIAGICNDNRNVLGMMPHPERAVEKLLGSSDGQFIFKSMIQSLVNA